MNKLLIIMIMLMAIVSCGCVNAKQIGSDAAVGALNAARDFGLKYSEKKNAAELNAAVTKGAEFGIEYDNIDTDGDGIYSGAEAASFAATYGQLKFKGEAQAAIDKLIAGDLEGAKLEAEKAGKGVAAYLTEALLAILMAGGSGKILLNRHKEATKREIHDERNNHRLIRGEPVGNSPRISEIMPIKSVVTTTGEIIEG